MSSPSLVPSSQPAAKRQRRECEEAATLQWLPDEMLLQSFSYSSDDDLASLACTSSFWAKLVLAHWKKLAVQSGGGGLILEEVWQSLRNTGQVVCVENNKTHDHITDTALNEVTLWRRCSLSRERGGGNVLKEDVDYHLVSEHGLPAPPSEEFNDDGVSPMLPGTYRFVVHIWNNNNERTKLSSRTMRHSLCMFSADYGSKIRLPLSRQSSVLQQLIRGGKFHALEIEIICSSDPARPVSAVLYSSRNNIHDADADDVYGGGSFEEYSAMPWFEWETGESSQEKPELWDWLPFVKVGVPDTSPVTHLCIDIEMQWRCRSGRGKRGDEYEFVRGMNATEIVTFLNHRISTSYTTRSSSSSDQPRCCLDELLQVPTLLQDYTPKPLGAYSFILDVKNSTDPANKNCTIFYERLPGEGLLPEEEYPSLQFDIPKRYDDFLPWGDDYDQVRYNGVCVDLDILFTVCVIDRRTGRHAKIYESEPFCALFEYWDLSHFVAFEKSAALTQFSNGPNVSTIPVPAMRGMILGAFRSELGHFEERKGSTRLRSLNLYLDFLSYQPGSPGTGQAIRTDMSSSEDFLVFLEKCLVYK